MTSVRIHGAFTNSFRVQVFKVDENLVKPWLDHEDRIDSWYWKKYILSYEQKSGNKLDEVCALVRESAKMTEGMVELCIECVSFRPSVFDMIFQHWIVPNKKKIKILSIYDCEDLSEADDVGLDAFLKEIVSDPDIQLEVLLYHTRNSEKRIPSYLSALQTQRNLRRLNLYGIILDKDRMDSLIRTVSENSLTLVYLELADCTFDNDPLYKGLADLADRNRLKLQILNLLGCEAGRSPGWNRYVTNPRFQIRYLHLPLSDSIVVSHPFTELDNFYLLKLTNGHSHIHIKKNRRLLNFMHQEAVEAFHVARALNVLNVQNPKIQFLPYEIIERILYFLLEMPILSNEQIQKILLFARNGGEIKQNYWNEIDPNFLDAVDCKALSYFEFTDTFKCWAERRFEDS